MGGEFLQSCTLVKAFAVQLLDFQLCLSFKSRLLIGFYPTRSIELKDNTVVIVLGASGDLAKKKTFPALFGLASCPSTSTRIPLTCPMTVPQPIPTKRYSDCRICPDKDGP